MKWVPYCLVFAADGHPDASSDVGSFPEAALVWRCRVRSSTQMKRARRGQPAYPSNLSVPSRPSPFPFPSRSSPPLCLSLPISVPPLRSDLQLAHLPCLCLVRYHGGHRGPRSHCGVPVAPIVRLPDCHCSESEGAVSDDSGEGIRNVQRVKDQCVVLACQFVAMAFIHTIRACMEHFTVKFTSQYQHQPLSPAINFGLCHFDAQSLQLRSKHAWTKRPSYYPILHVAPKFRSRQFSTV